MRAQRRRGRMKRARRKAAARFSRPEGSGNRFAATRARDFSESCRSTPPHPSRPFQAAPPSPQGEGGAVFCFCLPFTRPRRSLPPCHGAPGSSRPTRSARYPVAGIRKAPLVASGRDYIRRGRRLGGPCSVANLRKGIVCCGGVTNLFVGADDSVRPLCVSEPGLGRTGSSSPTQGCRYRLPCNRALAVALTVSRRAEVVAPYAGLSLPLAIQPGVGGGWRVGSGPPGASAPTVVAAAIARYLYAPRRTPSFFRIH